MLIVTNLIYQTHLIEVKVVGGFGYIRYKDETRNKLVTMSKAELLKRKPSTAAAEFLGWRKR